MIHCIFYSNAGRRKYGTHIVEDLSYEQLPVYLKLAADLILEIDEDGNCTVIKNRLAFNEEIPGIVLGSVERVTRKLLGMAPVSLRAQIEEKHGHWLEEKKNEPYSRAPKPHKNIYQREVDPDEIGVDQYTQMFLDGLSKKQETAPPEVEKSWIDSISTGTYVKGTDDEAVS